MRIWFLIILFLPCKRLHGQIDFIIIGHHAGKGAEDGMRQRKAGFLLLILLAIFGFMSVSGAEPLQDCHRVTNAASLTTQ